MIEGVLRVSGTFFALVCLCSLRIRASICKGVQGIGSVIARLLFLSPTMLLVCGAQNINPFSLKRPLKYPLTPLKVHGD